jgi:hypothetical protein
MFALDLYQLSSIIILIFVVFLLLLTLRSLSPSLLQSVRKVIFDNSILSSIILLAIIATSIYHD